MNYWLWLEERQTRVREATAVDGHLPTRARRNRIRLPRLLAVRTVPPGRPDATQSPIDAVASRAPRINALPSRGSGERPHSGRASAPPPPACPDPSTTAAPYSTA